jgi:hypothetical protein
MAIDMHFPMRAGALDARISRRTNIGARGFSCTKYTTLLHFRFSIAFVVLVVLSLLIFLILHCLFLAFQHVKRSSTCGFLHISLVFCFHRFASPLGWKLDVYRACCIHSCLCCSSSTDVTQQTAQAWWDYFLYM